MDLIAAFLFGDITTGISLRHQVLDRFCLLRDGDNTDAHPQFKLPTLPLEHKIIDIQV